MSQSVALKCLDRYGFPLAGLTAAEQAVRTEAAARETKLQEKWSRQVDLLSNTLQHHNPRLNISGFAVYCCAAAQACSTMVACADTGCSKLAMLLQAITWQPLSNTPPPSKLKQLIREGIPISHRPCLWYQLSGGAAMKRTEPAEYYTSLVSLGKLSSSNSPELSLDLFRTFSNHLVLSSYKALEAIRRIVTAFGRRNQSVMYSQNINYVVAFLLVVMGTTKEEEVFWTLTALMERRLPATSVVEVS